MTLYNHISLFLCENSTLWIRKLEFRLVATFPHSPPLGREAFLCSSAEWLILQLAYGKLKYLTCLV